MLLHPLLLHPHKLVQLFPLVFSVSLARGLRLSRKINTDYKTYHRLINSSFRLKIPFSFFYLCFAFVYILCTVICFLSPLTVYFCSRRILICTMLVCVYVLTNQLCQVVALNV